MTIDDVTKGLVTGLLAGIVILYSFRPTVAYPEWVIRTYEHPWVFVLLIAFSFLLMQWDIRAGALALIATTSLLFDYVTLAKRSLQPKSL
jgi:hypothetical protein